VGLSGRDLPAAQALAGHASVLARAAEYETSGAFPGQTASSLQALAFLHLLNGVSAADAVAFARTAGAEPPDSETSRNGADGSGGQGPGGDAPAGRDNPGDDDDPGDGGDPGGPPGGGAPGPGGGRPGGGATRPALPEITVPLATLQGLAARAGESRLLGPLDPAMTRDLALAAARCPHSRWEVTVVDDHGYAAGHGTARPRPGRQQQQPPPPPGAAGRALPARVNITVTQDRLRQLTAQHAQQTQPRPGAPPGGWHLTPATNRTWTLTLPGGQKLTVRLTVPTYDCDHQHEVDRYQPSARLRRLVQARDRECTFPTCSRPARESDFEHGAP
jgi:hypothetical protein